MFIELLIQCHTLWGHANTICSAKIIKVVFLLNWLTYDFQVIWCSYRLTVKRRVPLV